MSIRTRMHIGLSPDTRICEAFLDWTDQTQPITSTVIPSTGSNPSYIGLFPSNHRLGLALLRSLEGLCMLKPLGILCDFSHPNLCLHHSLLQIFFELQSDPSHNIYYIVYLLFIYSFIVVFCIVLLSISSFFIVLFYVFSFIF